MTPYIRDATCRIIGCEKPGLHEVVLKITLLGPLCAYHANHKLKEFQEIDRQERVHNKEVVLGINGKCLCGAELPWHLLSLGGLQTEDDPTWKPSGMIHNCSCGRSWKAVSVSQAVEVAVEVKEDV